MKKLIQANEIYQKILKVDEEINSLENDIKNVIKNDLDVAFEYVVKKGVTEKPILDEDGSLKNATLKDSNGFEIWLYGKNYPVSGCREETPKNTYESSDKKLNPSEFVIMFSSLLNYKKQIRKKLVKDFESLNLELTLKNPR